MFSDRRPALPAVPTGRILGLCLLFSLVPRPSLPAAGLEVRAADQDGVAVENLVVWLDPLDAPPPAPTAAELAATVEQVDEEFSPYTIAVRKGATVTFPNRDDVQHHVYSLSRPAQFEIPLHGGDVTESVVLDEPGLVPIGCNIHDWMLSYIMVVETPWFATTDADGKITFNELPAGHYRLSAWHPRLRSQHEQELTIGPDSPGSVTLDLRLRPDRRIRRAPSADGSSY